MNKQRKILIADDSKINQEFISEILGDKYQYTYANNGAEVIEYLNNNLDVDILLLDINMPIMNGFEVLETMNERHWIEEIPVVVISGESDTEFLRKAYELGATDYIPRPFSDITVQSRVKNTLTIYTKQKQLVQLVEEQVYEREELSNTMINIFSHTVEQRNFESGKHSLNIRKISDMLLHELMKITDQYHLSEKSISIIASLSTFHDIGKISIPRAILNKPGKLDPEEWEIMKTHSAKGDEIIASAEIPQDTFVVKTARAICRWHHERWDGKGYPDGLVGDEIPISAQVVAMADCYDALTSERSYKKAFSHDVAIEMICNGECGSFNPQLIQCLRVISPELKNALQDDFSEDIEKKNVEVLTKEALTNKELPLDDRSSRLFENEKVKKEFFMKQAAGIQFEFDIPSSKVTYNDWDNKISGKSFYFSELGEKGILSQKDHLKFLENLSKTSREKPDFSMDVLILVNNTYRWHRLNVLTVWPIRGNEYISILGQYIDIHDEVTANALDYLLANEQLSTLYNYLKKIFKVVRIIDPSTHKELTFGLDGEIIKTDANCSDYWDKNNKCENCVFINKKSPSGIVTHLETKDGILYSVISKTGTIKGQGYVLQMGFPMDNSCSTNDLSDLPERTRVLMLNFYKDGTTDAYSRIYLEDFESSVINSDALIMCDIDNFKKINDNYGHLAGDAALRSIASILKQEVINKGVVVRYGGDEFIIIFHKISDQEFEDTMRNIKSKISDVYLEEYNLHFSASIGGTRQKGTLKEMVAAADKHMYANKSRQGK